MSKKFSVKALVSTLVAVAMLLSFALVGCNTPAVMVDIDGEVGVQLSVSGDKVVSASVADDDDAAFLTGLSLQKSELKTAVNTIIKAMADKKLINGGVLLTVRGEKVDDLRTDIANDIKAALSDNKVKAYVIVQTATAHNDAQKLAEDEDVTYGKALLALNVAKADGKLDAEELAEKTIAGLAKLIETRNIKMDDYVADTEVFANIVPDEEGEKYDLNDAGDKIASEKNFVSKATAIDFAISSARGAAEDITIYSTKLEQDNGIYVWEITFRSGNMIYDVEIDAATGSVISSESEYENAGTEDDYHDYTSEDTSSVNIISENEAKQIAASDAGVSLDDASFTKAKLENNVYELDFTVGSNSYSYEIDAVNGTVLESEMN